MDSQSVPRICTSLIPNLLDSYAQNDADGVYLEYPVSPDSYASGFETVTYKHFANAVNSAARWLEKSLGRKSECHEVLAYLGPHDIRYMIFLIAAVKVGYVLLFISPRNSVAAQVNLFKVTKCHCLLTAAPEPPSVADIIAAADLTVLHVPEAHDLLHTPAEHYPYEKEFEAHRHEPLVIVHTSGSTGLPKPVVYTHAFGAAYYNLTKVQAPEGHYHMNTPWEGKRVRMFFMLPPFHAGGIHMLLFNAIYNKTTFIQPVILGPPTAHGLGEAIKRTHINAAFGSPMTCRELYEDEELLDRVSSSVKTFFYAGGDCPAFLGDKLTAKFDKFFTILGFTEIGNVPQVRRLGPWEKDLWKYIHIHPYLNVDFRYSHEDLSEMVIVRKPEFEYMQSPFALFPDLSEYATKDLFSPHPTKPDFWTYRGRADDIIVLLTGEKTNPVSFEDQVNSHPAVNASLVVGAQRFQTALLVEPRLVLETTAARADFLERIWSVIEEANSVCPAHAKVMRSHVLFTTTQSPMLRAGKGTVQRAATVALYRESIDRLYQDADKQAPIYAVNAAPVASFSVDELLEVIRLAILNVTLWAHIDDDRDIFAMGMDSLQVLQLTRDLKAVVRCPALAPSIVYTNRSVNMLALAVKNLDLSEQATRDDLETDRLQDIENKFAQHVSDMDRQFSAIISPCRANGVAAQDRIILLTGSTGSIGSYLLHSLLACPEVSHVYCINRAPNSADLQAQRNKSRGLPQDWDASRVTHLTGSLSATAFDLEQQVYDTLVRTVTEVIHAAWPVNFNIPLATFDTHLSGVVAATLFAAQADNATKIFFVSSVSAVQGLKSSAELTSIPEINFDKPESAGSTGYAASKYLAERLLAYATEKYGIATAVLRVGQVAGPSKKVPAGLWAPREWLPSLVISSASLGALPESLGSLAGPNQDDHEIDWLPVDTLADIIVELLDLKDVGRRSTTSASAEIFHLVNPQRAAWTDLARSVQNRLSTRLNKSIELVDFSAWVDRVKAAGQNVSNRSLNDVVKEVPAVKLIDFYESLLKTSNNAARTPLLETSETEQASTQMRLLKPITAEDMNAWVDGWIKVMR